MMWRIAEAAETALETLVELGGPALPLAACVAAGIAWAAFLDWYGAL